MRAFHGLGLSVLVFASLAPPQLERFESVEPHMGTLVRITIYTVGEHSAREAFRAAFNRIRDLDGILSDYQADSELNQITKTARRPVRVSDELFAVLRASQDLAYATDGAFDITQGPVIQLWREARKTGRVPDPTALKEAVTRSGFRKLHVDATHRTATFHVPGMALDVGGIGKGYAASEALEVLTGLGIRSALVAVSGDLAFSAAPPGKRGWRIGIHSGDRSPDSFPEMLELTNAAVSTSGNSDQHLDLDGRRHSHIIDPASGLALVNDLTITVVARHGLDADGLDTAMSVLGPERGLALIESRRDAAALIMERKSAGVTFVASSRFRALARLD
jgi:thiamine biosynthesis lipoprotein